jgi:hypothetical protein
VVAGTSRLHDAVRESSRSACSRLQVDPELRDLIHHDRTDSLEESIFQVVARLVAGSSCRCVSMFQNVGLPEIELPRCPSRPWYSKRALRYQCSRHALDEQRAERVTLLLSGCTPSRSGSAVALGLTRDAHTGELCCQKASRAPLWIEPHGAGMCFLCAARASGLGHSGARMHTGSAPPRFYTREEVS